MAETSPHPPHFAPFSTSARSRGTRRLRTVGAASLTLLAAGGAGLFGLTRQTPGGLLQPGGAVTPSRPLVTGSASGLLAQPRRQSAAAGAIGNQGAPAVPPAQAPAQGADAWSGVLFSGADPWAPGATVPRGRRPTPGGAPGSAAVAAPAKPTPPLGADEQPGAERASALYREALVHWADGETDRACGELVALETRVVRDADLRTARALLRWEEKVVDQVAADDLEVLVPIANLHFEVFRRYLDLGAVGHALVQRHSRIMIHDLALLYRKQSGSEGARLVASHQLASLADLLQRGAQHQAAAELYTQAAELDPHNAVPALSLAIIYEKFEQYRSAVTWLRQVLAISPKHPEARLRLAINLGRVGETAEALALLEGLTAETADSWLTPLAFQEEARLLERRQSYGKATDVLRAGLERFPQSVRMRVQLAAALDRQGKSQEARHVLSDVAQIKPDPQDGSRFRYNMTSTDAVAVSRAFFAENASSRMRVLADALAHTAAAGPAEAAVKPQAVQP
jgi:tetratricopeptide (TPR) repeat protein